MLCHRAAPRARTLRADVPIIGARSIEVNFARAKSDDFSTNARALAWKRDLSSPVRDLTPGA
jgi:hypothetical protein